MIIAAIVLFNIQFLLDRHFLADLRHLKGLLAGHPVGKTFELSISELNQTLFDIHMEM